MEQHQLDSLCLLGCAIHGEKAVIKDAAAVPRAIHECYGQNCELLAISAVVSSAGENPSANIDKLKSFLINRKMAEALRVAGVGKMLKALERGGHRPVLIKGPVLADLYPDPLLRQSVDTDLFFETERERDDAQTFLLSCGATLENDAAEKKHSSIKFPGVGTVELHKSLYDDDFRRLQLKGEPIVSRPLQTLTLRNGLQVSTLDKTDTLKYIFCHMIQHFLFSRCDLRQICDILLYIKKYKREIDRSDLNAFLEKTGYARAFETVLAVGIKYLSFSSADLFPVSGDVDAEGFLTDCFNGCARGVWGRTSMPRGSGIFAVGYNEEKFADEKPRFRRAALKSVVRKAFPPRNELASIYPFCAKNPLMLPVAWAANIRDLAAGVISNRNRFRERKTLLEKMGLL